jgi:hypothetical protein
VNWRLVTMLMSKVCTRPLTSIRRTRVVPPRYVPSTISPFFSVNVSARQNSKGPRVVNVSRPICIKPFITAPLPHILSGGK